MNIKKVFIFTALIIASSFQLLKATTLEETFKKRLDASAFNEVKLENVNGSIEVSCWKNNEVEIVAYKKVHASGSDRAQKLMELLTIDVIEDGDLLVIETRLPRHRRGSSGGFFSWLFNGGSSGTSVSYELRVPEKMDMDVQSTNGTVSVMDCSGSIQLATTNGKIRAEEVSGALRAKSTNGSLNISMRKVTPNEEMSFKTTNGSIKLFLPSDVDADVEARTTNGHVRCELPLTKSYEKSKRRLEGEINNGGPLIYLKTTNGSISILEY